MVASGERSGIADSSMSSPCSFSLTGASGSQAGPSTESEMVIEKSKPHFSSFRHSMLLVMLGVCVFLWGFGYKLSLYNIQEPTLHRVPEAKLLSKNEDSRAVDGVRQVLSLGKLRQPTMFFRLVAVTIRWLAFARDAGISKRVSSRH